MSNEQLIVLANVPSTIQLGDRNFKISPPTLQTLAEASNYSKEEKKKKRKEQIKERLELFAELPKDMKTEEKKSFLDSIIVPPLTPQDKMNILNSMEESIPFEERNKRLAIIAAERDTTDFSETLYILWKCIQKYDTKVTLSEIEGLVTIKDLTQVLDVLNPKDVGSTSSKNE